MNKRTIGLLTAVCIICALSFFPPAIAQTDKLKPTWASENYHKVLENSYLEVAVIRGEQDLTKMRKMAQDEIERRRHSTVGVEGDIWMKAKLVAEYLDKDGTGYFLYQTLKNPTYTPESVSTTDRYPFSARVFVPGWAQIYKGSYGKGAAFITGEVLFVGGIVTTQFLTSYYRDKMRDAHSSQEGLYYENCLKVSTISRNVCIGGAVAVYVWNIIDGAVAKGRPHLVDKDGKSLSFNPFITTNCTGIALNFRF